MAPVLFLGFNVTLSKYCFFAKELIAHIMVAVFGKFFLTGELQNVPLTNF